MSAGARLWRNRELVRTLAEREIRARYAQTFLGPVWAIVSPFALMLVFSTFVRRVGNVDTGGAPYALFAYMGLLPWNFFSTAVNQGGVSLVNNVPLLNKVYCPREVFPLASVVVAFVDTAIAFVALVVIFLVKGFTPKDMTVLAPLLFAVQGAFTIGVTLLVSSVVVYFRDLRATLPLVLQLGLFATPVAYGFEAVPAHLRPVYSVLNPLGPVIDGYRRTILHGEAPQWDLLVVAAGAAAMWLALGYYVFKRLEGGIADIA